MRSSSRLPRRPRSPTLDDLAGRSRSPPSKARSRTGCSSTSSARAAVLRSRHAARGVRCRSTQGEVDVVVGDAHRRRIHALRLPSPEIRRSGRPRDAARCRCSSGATRSSKRPSAPRSTRSPPNGVLDAIAMQVGRDRAAREQRDDARSRACASRAHQVDVALCIECAIWCIVLCSTHSAHGLVYRYGL